MTHPAPKATLYGIQYLRAVAAMLVVIFHLCKGQDVYFAIGTGGVDIFFVISGFVMWLTTYQKNVSFKSFMLRRILRLVPLYWLVTCATACAIYLKPQFFYGVSLTVEHFIKSLLFIPFYAPTGDIWPLVLQGWTLNMEMFFYLLFACALLVASNIRLRTITILMCGIVITQLLLNSNFAPLKQWANPVLLELLAGVWLGSFYTAGKLRSKKWGIVTVCTGAAGYVLLHVMHYEHNAWNVVLVGIPAFMIVCGTLMIECESPIPRYTIPTFLGDASYSLYIWHGLFRIITSALLLRFDISTGYLKAAIELFVMLSFSLTAYQMIERPFNKYVKNHYLK